MGRKLTYKYVRDYFKEQGCELLEKEYINNSTKMRYKCSCGNISEIIFNNFKAGKRCFKCKKSRIVEKLSFTYEFIKKFFEKNGCEMLDIFYKNARTHINYKCSCGNISKIIFDSFRRGHRCKKCATIKNAKNQSFTFDYVRDFFKQYGCELLEKKYINNNTKMKYKCSCGGIDKISFSNFKTGKRCKKCGIKKVSGKNNYGWIKDRVVFEENKKIRKKYYAMLKYSLNRTNQVKTDRTHIILGYYPEDLQKHIQNHPNWENVKNKRYHLDHILPIQAFVDYGVKDIKLINCLDNLQPLTAQQNVRKNANYNKEEFENWLKEKKYEI